MIKKLLLTLSILSLIACGNDQGEIIYKTKGGEYASKAGNFVADFPTEPLNSINNSDTPEGLESIQSTLPGFPVRAVTANH